MSATSSRDEVLFRTRSLAPGHAKMTERQARAPARATVTRYLEVDSMPKKIAILVAALSLSAPVALYAADAPATDGKTAVTAKSHGQKPSSGKKGKPAQPSASKAQTSTNNK
jgi:hypothetical protein